MKRNHLISFREIIHQSHTMILSNMDWIHRPAALSKIGNRSEVCCLTPPSSKRSRLMYIQFRFLFCEQPFTPRIRLDHLQDIPKLLLIECN
jgi:hypothetical protein